MMTTANHETGYYPLCASTDEAGRRYGNLAHHMGPIEPHMMRLIGAVSRALESGLFYSDAVLAAVIADFGNYLQPGDTEIGKSEVSGGQFGMEVYYARRYLDACDQRVMLDAAAEKLALRNGTHLGTLMFNDFKVTTGCVASGVSRSGVTVTGKRGRTVVRFSTNAVAIDCAIERAFEKGKRPSATLAHARAMIEQPPRAPAPPLDFGLFAPGA
ncbi:hypothetical protein PSP6_700014 [Paraburkholderia tropica]|uniref:hypothetical protein n=1 Tax=Paraburkholderia tropica TaxID=92647 RepID=UPI001CAE0730|nr:hypothetical protein [Paraburkholderia tropica]CAG9236931.1 hypothetical protein PSP6_700014 [Paraburkholderia tropica]